MFRIAMFAILLVGVVLLRQPCSEGIGRFVESFDSADAGPTGTLENSAHNQGEQPGSAPGMQPGAAPGPTPGPINGFYPITGDMSEEEIRATLRKAGVKVDDDESPDGGAPGNTSK